MELRMDWNKLLSATRFYLEDKGELGEPARSPFEKDYDRILFSSSFRRLGKKTQVHPFAKNDHIHSRLTHSLEVSTVGRSLGMLCGKWIREKEKLPEFTELYIAEIVEAACLAHDIGNPPFGHAGEEAISEWFSNNLDDFLKAEKNDRMLTKAQQNDLLNFDGNAQSFRIVTKLERHRLNGGMRMTYATLASMLKYPHTSSCDAMTTGMRKFSVFQSEREDFKKVADHVGLIKTGENSYCRHPLAFLVEAADDICYRILDLEDACEMKLLSFEEIKDLLKPLCETDDEYKEIVEDNGTSSRRKMAFMRAKSIGTAVEHVSKAFIGKYEEIMKGFLHDELISCCDSKVRDQLDKAKAVMKDRVFNERHKLELEIGCFKSLGILLDCFCRAVSEGIRIDSNPSFKDKKVLEILGGTRPSRCDDLYTALLRATDYISGMTDDYASFMTKQIGGMGS